jgi:hypothetical protein
MRGDDERSGHLFNYLSPDQQVPADHRLRPIRPMTDAASARLAPRFALLYAPTGRPSVPPEHLLGASLPQVLDSIRSQRMLSEGRVLHRWHAARCPGGPEEFSAQGPAAILARRPQQPDGEFHGEQRSNTTHQDDRS